MARRPNVIQTARPMAKPFRRRARQVRVDKKAQTPCSVRVPRGGVLRISGQVTRLVAVLGCAGRQFLPQRKR